MMGDDFCCSDFFVGYQVFGVDCVLCVLVVSVVEEGVVVVEVGCMNVMEFVCWYDGVCVFDLDVFFVVGVVVYGCC